MDFPPVWTSETQEKKDLHRDIISLCLQLSCNLTVKSTDSLKKLRNEHSRLSELITQEKLKLLKEIKKFTDFGHEIDKNYTIDDNLEDIKKGYDFIVSNASDAMKNRIKEYGKLGYQISLNGNVYNLNEELINLVRVKKNYLSELADYQSKHRIWQKILDDPSLMEDKSNLEVIAHKYIK